ncbi:MAG: hypothetical protein KatS3mg007_1745 [Thermoanaerobaculum sp.]|jgi:hypothetical protein|nr:MAG: hypothetical protein KatS3mg007_1745 [Thermoanaerobaculum sp.]GBC80246.1 hypothetical protein HRbin09_01480 [bacterium HR09]
MKAGGFPGCSWQSGRSGSKKWEHESGGLWALQLSVLLAIVAVLVM